MKFGTVPATVAVQRSLDLCAPLFAAAVQRTLARLVGGPTEMVFETLRTPERQSFLYGFGRDYDDGRGKVTKARTSLTSWHGYGLACDVVEKDTTPWAVPDGFWGALGEAAEAEGLAWGGRWTHRSADGIIVPAPDLPHLQWAVCPASPTADDIWLLHQSGLPAVWNKYGAAA